MDYICCYFDVQGFYHNDKFFPREFAILSESGASVFSVNHGLKWKDLTSDERKQAAHNTRFNHGLPFDAKKGTPMPQIRSIVKAFYEMNRDEDHYLMACKSQEAEAMLRDFDITRINLLSMGLTWSIMKCNTNPCALHINPGKCSLNAVIGMANWVKKQSAPEIIWVPNNLDDPKSKK